MNHRTLLPVLFLAAIANAQQGDAGINPLADYGRINQKSVTPAGMPANSGLWACGPTALANSLGYLERRYPAYYRRTLVPDTNGNNVVDDAEIKAVAEALCAALYMDLQPPAGNNQMPCDANDYYPDIHGRGDGNRPGGDSGGVTFPRFALGKDCWFRRVGVPRTIIRGQYRDAWPAAPHPAKPAWLAANVKLDARTLFDDVKAGYDVEIGFTWQLAGRDGFGGHCVTVRGYDFKNGDLDRDGELDAGETATLRIIDPWDPAGCAILQAPDLAATLSKNAAGELFLDYAGGAAGIGGAQGRIRMWCSEGVPRCLVMADAATYGFGKRGANGVGAWDLGSPARTPVLDRDYTLRLVRGVPATPPIVLFGPQFAAGVPIPPLASTLWISPVFGNLAMPMFDATGTSVMRLPVPAAVNLCGARIAFQGVWLDPLAAAMLGHSDGLLLTLGD